MFMPSVHRHTTTICSSASLSSVHASPAHIPHHRHYFPQGNPELGAEKEDAHINLVVRTLLAHFGGTPNSGLSTVRILQIFILSDAYLIPHGVLNTTSTSASTDLRQCHSKYRIVMLINYGGFSIQVRML